MECSRMVNTITPQVSRNFCTRWKEVTSWKTSDNGRTIAGCKMVPKLCARWGPAYFKHWFLALTLEPFSGVSLDPRGPKRVCNISCQISYVFKDRKSISALHGVQTDPRKRVTWVILETVLGLKGHTHPTNGPFHPISPLFTRAGRGTRVHGYSRVLREIRR